jgi:hypothetical protein
MWFGSGQVARIIGFGSGQVARILGFGSGQIAQMIFGFGSGRVLIQYILARTEWRQIVFGPGKIKKIRPVQTSRACYCMMLSRLNLLGKTESGDIPRG